MVLFPFPIGIQSLDRLVVLYFTGDPDYCDYYSPKHNNEVA